MPTCALPSIGDDCAGSTFGDFKVVIRGYDGSGNLLGGETVATFSIASGPFESLSNFTVVKGAL